VCVRDLASTASRVRAYRVLTTTCAPVIVYGAMNPTFGKDDVRFGPADWSSFPIFISMAIYAFEGIGLVLPIENAARNKPAFPLLYSTGLGVVAVCGLAVR
jgi:hypothetical protein